ncbi:MAG: GTP-binding protein [Clostridia bacterium]|nr:GTP-binding protein [Clostridia bacterium]
MTKIDVISGFLGAGMTNLIKKLIKEAYAGQKLVIIENEFGQIAIDGGFLKESGIQITEMNSGCICCSLVGDFRQALGEVVDKFSPDRIVIEPSGVGKLSDVVRAVESVEKEGVVLNSAAAVVDANKAKVYVKNFGEFYLDQLESASAIILSRTQDVSDEKLKAVIDLVSEHNKTANLITTPWDKLDGKQILAAMENKDLLKAKLDALLEDDDDDDDDDGHDEHECHHEHHHDHDHDHEHHECCDHDHDHEHEHEHGEHCHHHHGHHHADDVFTSWGVQTARKFDKEELTAILSKLNDSLTYGQVLRSKGIVPAKDGSWLHFDFVPGESEVRTGTAEITGSVCVIGSKLDEEELSLLFK